VVTITNDSGAGTLRAAIGNTNGFSNCDTITFSLLNPSTITLSSGIGIGRDLTVTGPGAVALTVSGGNATNIFIISSGTVAISGLTIANGKTTGVGGAIYLRGGKLTLSDSVVRDSFAGNQGGGIKQDGGTLLLERSLFTGNRASSDGGGLYVSGGTDATIANSTFVGNEANFGGGVTFPG
jgi:predicted outer membrane repeat protein